jgi:hypothetical protein
MEISKLLKVIYVKKLNKSKAPRNKSKAPRRRDEAARNSVHSRNNVESKHDNMAIKVDCPNMGNKKELHQLDNCK